MIVVTAPARLHFGLFHPTPDDAAAGRWPTRDGQLSLPARRFGGVGLMIDSPTLCLRLEPSTTWTAEGPSADRALSFARRFAATAPDIARPQRIVIETAPPEHVGFGSGTQLGLAIAHALAQAWDITPVSTPELACLVGRGLRSGIGVHGFAHGGLLVDCGKTDREGVAPLLLRRDFPEAWRVLLARPATAAGIHGICERQWFQKMTSGPGDLRRMDALCRLVLLGLVPALDALDLETFGEALFDFNARAGEAFAAAQGGVYASSAATELVNVFRKLGVRGAGQSSWGPTVFAVVDGERAEETAQRLRQQVPGCTVSVARGCNRGASVVRATP